MRQLFSSVGLRGAIAAVLLPVALAVAPTSAMAATGRFWGGSSVADLVEKVDGAVVSIDTVARANRDPAYELFFGEEMPDQKGVGSGFIIDPSGLIVTNNHVVRGATGILVTTAAGQEYRGQVIGADPANDLALIKVSAKGLPALKFANGDHVRVGDWVVAIGSPLGLSHTVSVGIISATNRGIAISDRVNYIQTDAAINPGNSGGPLLNMAGEVVGVNTAVAARGQGIGFAIPAWTAQTVVEQLKTKGRVERTWLGVSIRDVAVSGMRGVLVVGTVNSGPARRGGILPGDIVIQVDNQAVRTARDLLSYLNVKPAGTSVKLTVLREGKKQVQTIVLQAAPDQPLRR